MSNSGQKSTVICELEAYYLTMYAAAITLLIMRRFVFSFDQLIDMKPEHGIYDPVYSGVQSTVQFCVLNELAQCKLSEDK